jgi:hypothetical protein
VCSCFAASFTGRHEAKGRHVNSVSGPYTTDAFWIVRACAPHRAYVRRFWLVGESRTTGNSARGELSSRTGAERRCLRATENVRGGIAFRERLVQPSLRRGESDIERRTEPEG